MRTYTEKELLLAVKYASGTQKAADYQTAGEYLIGVSERGIEAVNASIELTLNSLYDTDNDCSPEITLEELHEYFEENK